MSPYQSRGYYQRPNPDGALDFAGAMEIIPAGVLGILAGRWATQMAGPFEMGPEGGAPVPGIKHAVAIWLAAAFGGQMIGAILGDGARADVARIACLSWGGDLFLRKRFLRDNVWLNTNVYMGEVGQGTFVDAAGNRYLQTPQGWAVAGFEERSAIGQVQLPADAKPGDVVQTATGQYYQVMSGAAGLGLQPVSAGQAQAAIGAFEERSPIGRYDNVVDIRTKRGFGQQPAALSSFGY